MPCVFRAFFILCLLVTGVARADGPVSKAALLERAIQASDCLEIEKQLASGADPNAHSTASLQDPLLLTAATESGPQAVELLLRYGADANARDARGTPILLSLASLVTPDASASAKVLGSIRLLLALGHADPDLSDSAQVGDDRSALHQAAASGSLELVELLISHGARIDKPNRVNETPLYFAVSRGRVAIASRLLSEGANPNVKATFTGMTPLMAAAEIGNLELVRILLARKADLLAKNTFGHSPISLSSTLEIRRLLQRALEARLLLRVS
jgi:ankyrin repeat protein